MAAPCNEEQRGQATRKPCNRARSVLTVKVNVIEGKKRCIHRALQEVQEAVN